MQIWLRRTKEGFAFRAPYDEELAKGVPVGGDVKCDIRGIRSGGQHRLYWALVRTTWKHQDHYPSPERLHVAIKFELGIIKSIELLDGTMTIIPSSIEYDTMDQFEFHAYFERTVDLILLKILPGIPREALLREVYALLKIPYRSSQPSRQKMRNDASPNSD